MAIAMSQDNYRLVSDYRAINNTLEQPTTESLTTRFQGAKLFRTPHLLQGYGQIPLRPDAQDLFTVVTAEGLFTPTRVP